jgi:ankyrin repeat protein
MFGLIELMVAKGANVNARLIGRTEVHDAIPSTWLKEEGATALLRAAWCGDLEVIKLLLAHGADPNITTKDGTTALMALAGVGFAEGFIKDYGGRAKSAEGMRLLIKAGADVNAKNADLVTALHGAAHKNFIEGIQILVDNGADLSAQSLWRKIPATPLDWAIGVRIGGSSTIYRTEAVALLQKLLDERHVTVKTVYPNNMRGG